MTIQKVKLVTRVVGNGVKRVIAVGLDGLEPKIVEPMLQAGELPNFDKPRARGGYSRLRTTYPAQTPVAWSTFATGTSPGGHGLSGFIRRPDLVPGVLLMNQPFRTEQATKVDLAPTILAALGVPKGAAIEGESLLE